MKLISYDGAQWLLGDDATSALLEFAIELARHESADSVTFSALTLDGRPEELTLLIGPATMMTAESYTGQFAEPDNADAERSVRDEIAKLTPTPILPAADEVQQDQLDEY